MIQFSLDQQSSDMVLYVAQGVNASQPYWFAYVSFTPGAPVPQNPTLSDIWTNMVLSPSGNPPGDFIFSTTAPADPQFLQNLETYLATCRNNKAIGYYVWIDDPAAPAFTSNAIQSMLAYGLSSGFNPSPILFTNMGAGNQILFENIYLSIPTSSGIDLDTTNDIFSFSSPFPCSSSPSPGTCIALHAEAGDSYMFGIKQTVSMPLTGASAFTLTFPFTMTVQGGSLQNNFTTLDVSIKYFYQQAAPGTMVIQNSYPVFGLPADGSSSVTFSVSLDPLYPTDRVRSCFTFPTSPPLISGFTTDMGHEIILTPDGTTSGLVFTPEITWSTIDNKQIASYCLAPKGNFYMSLAAGDTSVTPKLICGMSATEGLGFVPAGNGYVGDTLVFYPDNNAYSPVYPLPASNGTTPPVPAANLLSNTYTTSWANILTTATPLAKNNYYYSQPPSSSLYATGTSGQAASFLWFFEPPSVDLSSGLANFCFPVVPYSTIYPNTDPDEFFITDFPQFENQVLFPTRKSLLSTSSGKGLQKKNTTPPLLTGARNLKGTLPPVTTPTLATTPQGLLATVGTNGEYQTVQLASNNDNGLSCTLQLENVPPLLTDALQTNQLFMVATSAANIGTLWSPNSPPPNNTEPSGPGFENFMSIAQWPFVLNVGQNCSYGNYSNVLIFKFCPGKLIDMMTHPEQWTQSTDFINTGEVQAAAGWLQNYVNNAVARYQQDKANNVKNSFYENFNTIVNDATWNGILCLKVDISLTSFPPELKGLLAGIDLSKFNAHHFGININHVTSTGGLAMQPHSSMFGLIDYEDPAYIAQQQQNPGSTDPVQPQPGVYNFKVLKLEVLFENTQIADFSSSVQVTMNNLFGDNVSLAALPDGSASYNSVVLNGTYQDHNNTPVYVFDSTIDNPFMTGGNILTEVEMVKVQFDTIIKQNSDPNMVYSRFSLWGYMHFAQLPASVDLFSFGDNGTSLDQGLYFSNLYIDMSFDIQTPSAKTMVFDPLQIAFDVQQSTPRPDGLYSVFPLTLTGFVTGDNTKTPASMNYLTVNLPQVSASALGNSWNGLVFNLNLGTPGALASSAGFSSSFLMAWAPNSTGTNTFKVFAGIQLPGTAGVGNMMGIQGVLKLAIDSVQLQYSTGTQTQPASPPGYLLMLNNIALKFLGILQFPPSGSTNCYIFGSPSNTGQANDLAWYAVYVGPNGPTGAGTGTQSLKTAKAVKPMKITKKLAK
ncbi:MAG: hypothetical protein JWP12_2533 [Bacteroidetes bacterium]|nr:hypothetical protein [Bacteroidota bacterium]